MKKIKTIMALILVLSLLSGSSVIATVGAGIPAIVVSSAEAAPGETVDVSVSLENNPGINSFTLGISYDTTRLSLNGVTAAEALGGQFTYVKNIL